MICPRCHTPIGGPSNFCPSCGARLHHSVSPVLIGVAIFVLVALLVSYGFLHYHFSRDLPDASRSSARALHVGAPGQPGVSGSKPLTSPDDSGRRATMRTVDFTLNDIAGRERLAAPVVVLSQGWFAFPKRRCLGGYVWRIHSGAGEPALEVEGAILQDADPVGLWQVTRVPAWSGPGLRPWNPAQPLAWQSLLGQEAPLEVRVADAEPLGSFARFPFGDDETAPGVFIQDGRVVGWSFGPWAEGGYLWEGNPGSELIPRFYTDDFYRLTFADSQEEALLTAMANESLTDFQRLAALVDAYRLEARLTAEDVPDDIRPDRVQAAIRRLIQGLRADGRAEDVYPLFDPQILLVIDNPVLAIEIATIAREMGAYAEALEMIAALSIPLTAAPVVEDEVERFYAALYQSWLAALLSDNETAAALSLYEEARTRLPQDPFIHLVGVELALESGDRALAESLLIARRYPLELQGRVDRLQQWISELKSQEGKIVIRFQPGSSTIVTSARLGRGLDQSFIVDTGASLVTVPAATVRALGIDLADNLPRRLFYSATGVHNAIEVILPYIEMGGWVVADVPALVVDLPGQPGMGLLGMNYLRNFRVDVNTIDGVLLLEPR